jgi:hypothetical protein
VAKAHPGGCVRKNNGPTLYQVYVEHRAKSMFRFEELDIWKNSIEILDELLDIAEGAGCQGNAEFIKFLGYSRRSAFEVVNMLTIFCKRKYITTVVRNKIVDKLEQLCKMISGFIRTLSS